MMSGIATIVFLLIVNGKIPSYLGTSASFVGGVVAIRAQGGDSGDVVGSILVAGGVISTQGVIIHFSASGAARGVATGRHRGRGCSSASISPRGRHDLRPQDQRGPWPQWRRVMVVAVGFGLHQPDRDRRPFRLPAVVGPRHDRRTHHIRTR
jgi:hypothetical protein